MQNNVSPIRLLVADDHPMIRQGFSQLFSQQCDLALCDVAASGQELLELTKKHRPDVIITDIKMPGMCGREASTRIKSLFPEVGIIVFSMYDHEELMREMRSAGVRGYLLKGCDPEEVYSAVRAVHNGGEYYCSTVRERITKLFQYSSLGMGSGEIKDAFSEKELQIIKLICEEKTSKEIAHVLSMNTRTIESYKQKLQEKMGVSGTVGIAIYACKNWLLY